VLRHVRARQEALGVEQLPADEIANIAAAFQATVVDTLVDRAFAAAKWHHARSVGIAGGVSANSRLRAAAGERGARAETPVFVPSPHLSTDNAAMIAAAGLRKLAGRLGGAGSERRRVAAAVSQVSGIRVQGSGAIRQRRHQEGSG
jgi:N6-L-threonylcarbamoyladenine synthase